MISIEPFLMTVATSLSGTFMALMIFPSFRRRFLAFFVRRAVKLVREYRGRSSVFGKAWSMLKGSAMIGTSVAVVGTCGFVFLFAAVFFFGLSAMSEQPEHPPAGTCVGYNDDMGLVVADGYGGTGFVE